MSFVIDRRLEIAAPPEVVWRVITDFPAYGEWNTFVVTCESTLEVGSPIDMRVVLFAGRPQSQREYIKEHTPGRSFAYGVPPMPLGAMQSTRSHLVESSPSGCAYTSHWELDGWLAPVVRLFVGRRLEAGFGAMSNEIKARAEALAKEPAPS